MYGGQAINEYLKSKKQPIYNKNDIPDYDVYRPNAWNHAKELADKLYYLGYKHV